MSSRDYDLDGMERLGMAVVKQAVNDWRSARRALNRHPDNHAAEHEMKRCEKFFLSEHFMMFTDLDGKALLECLRREG